MKAQNYNPVIYAQLFLFVAMPSDYGNILFPVATFAQALEFADDTEGIIVQFYQNLN